MVEQLRGRELMNALTSIILHQSRAFVAEISEQLEYVHVQTKPLAGDCSNIVRLTGGTLEQKDRIAKEQAYDQMWRTNRGLQAGKDRSRNV